MHHTNTRNLFRIDLPVLNRANPLRLHRRLPRRHPTGKDILDVLKRLPRRLRKAQKTMHRHRHTKQSKEEVRLPFDILERGGREVAQREVEDPVTRRRHGHGLAAESEREEFRAVDPRDGAPRGGEGCDHEVGACNDGFRGRAGDLPAFFGRAVDTAGRGGVAVGGEEAGAGEPPDCEGGGSEDEGDASADAVDEEQGGDGDEYVDHVVDRGGD